MEFSSIHESLLLRTAFYLEAQIITQCQLSTLIFQIQWIIIWQGLSHKFRLLKTVEEKRAEDQLQSVQMSTYSIVNGTTMRSLGDEFVQRFNIGTKGLCYDVSYSPKQLNTKDQFFTVTHNDLFDYTTTRLNGVGGLRYGSPLFGPVRFWKTVSIKNQKMILFLAFFLSLELDCFLKSYNLF